VNQFVIKGRGENRGKYLCCAWQAGLPPGGFVWLPEQRKAARWEEHRANRYAYPGTLAIAHNGYFVRLVCRHHMRKRINELKAYISSHAGGAAERPPCHWLDGDWSGDEGPNYCWDCACKEVDEAYAKDPKQFAELYGYADDDENETKPKNVADYYHDAIRGGYSMDHDSMPYCERKGCGKSLEGTLTDYGADEEIAALADERGIRFDDVESWYRLSIAVMNIRNDDPRWNKIARVIDAAMEQERQKAAQRAASFGMTKTRCSLLGLLEARKAQMDYGYCA